LKYTGIVRKGKTNWLLLQDHKLETLKGTHKDRLMFVSVLVASETRLSLKSRALCQRAKLTFSTADVLCQGGKSATMCVHYKLATASL
jgi:hypothetical protein